MNRSAVNITDDMDQNFTPLNWIKRHYKELTAIGIVVFVIIFVTVFLNVR